MGKLPRPEKLILAFLLAIIVFAALLHFSDTRKVLTAITNLPLSAVPILLAIATISFLTRIFRWHLLLKASTTSIRTKKLIVPFMISQAASLITPGKVGDPLRCFLLKEHRVRKTLGSVVVERVLDFTLLIILATSLLIGSNTQAILPVFVAAALTLSVIAVFASRRLAKQLWKNLSRLQLVRKYEKHLSEFYHTVRKMAGRKELAYSALLTGAVWAIDFLRLSLTFAFLSYPISILTAGQIFSAALIIGTLSMIPGGMGGQEIVMLTLFSTIGLPLHIITAAIIIDRLVSYWYPIFIGFFLIPYR